MAVEQITSDVGSLQNSKISTYQQTMGKDEFFKLLIAQLQHQDPLNPMDNTAFVSQLAEFSSLEQLNNVNEGLNGLALAQTASVNSQIVSYIGKDIEAVGNTFKKEEGKGKELGYDLARDAEKVTISVQDKDGNIIWSTEESDVDGGSRSVYWDGKDFNGNQMPEGEYSFIVKATDTEDNEVDSTTRMRGTVTGVSYENGYPELMIGSARIALGDVIDVLEGSSSSSSDLNNNSLDSGNDVILNSGPDERK